MGINIGRVLRAARLRVPRPASSTGTTASPRPAWAWCSASCSTCSAARALGDAGLAPGARRDARGAVRARAALARSSSSARSSAVGIFGVGMATGAIPVDRRPDRRWRRVSALDRHRRVLRVAVPVRRLDAGGTQPSLRHRRVSSWRRRSSGPSSSRPDRRSTSSPTASTRNEIFGYAFPSSLVSVHQPASSSSSSRRSSPGSGSSSGSREPSSPVKFSIGLIGVGLGFRAADSRRQARRRRHAGQSDVAASDVPDPHDRRTLPESCRPEFDDQARAGAHRQPDDGRVVPGRVGRQLHWRPLGGLYESLPLDALFSRVGLFAVACGVLMLAFSGRFARMMK